MTITSHMKYTNCSTDRPYYLIINHYRIENKKCVTVKIQNQIMGGVVPGLCEQHGVLAWHLEVYK